jgi:hypothetical protein
MNEYSDKGHILMDDSMCNRDRELSERSTSSSSSVCLSVCGVGGILPNALQLTEAYCANPRFWFPRSSLEALYVRRRERPLSAKGGTVGEKGPIKFSLTNATSTSL